MTPPPDSVSVRRYLRGQLRRHNPRMLTIDRHLRVVALLEPLCRICGWKLNSDGPNFESQGFYGRSRA